MRRQPLFLDWIIDNGIFLDCAAREEERRRQTQGFSREGHQDLGAESGLRRGGRLFGVCQNCTVRGVVRWMKGRRFSE